MEQEEECRYVSEALSRAGIPISSSALRRALVIPTDRPIETCLAGLPAPLEGLRDAPYPAPPPPPLRSSAVYSSSPPGLSRTKAAGVAVGTALGLSQQVGGVRKMSPTTPGLRGVGAVRGRGKK
eukprot:g5623.t2